SRKPEPTRSKTRYSLLPYPGVRCFATPHWLPAWWRRFQSSCRLATLLRTDAPTPRRKLGRASPHRSAFESAKASNDRPVARLISVPENLSVPENRPPARRYLAPSRSLQSSPPAASENTLPAS